MADQIAFTSTATSNTITFDSSTDTITSVNFAGSVAVAPEGPQGDPGVGVPIGGAEGQVLAKNSATNYDTEWVTPSSVGGGYQTADYVVAPYGSPLAATDYIQSATEGEVDIQAIIDEASTAATAAGTVKTICFLSGVIGVSAPFAPRSNVKLYSEGGTVFRNVAGWGVGVPADQIDAATIIQDDGTAFENFKVEELTFIGNRTLGSTSCAIHLSGSRDINNPGAPVISNFTLRNCRFEHMQLLPVKLFGLSGSLVLSGCFFEDNADPGFGFNEEVIAYGNHSKDSHDNGFSFSRGNQKVTIVGNTVETPTLYGIWMGGYNGDEGPHEFTCTGNTIIDSRRSGITLEGSAYNGVISGNYIQVSTERPTDSHQDGIEIYGDSSVQRAHDITVTGNTIKYAPRAGVSVNNADNITIVGNMFIDIGTEYMADNSTVILSSNTTTNIGVLSTALNNTNVYVASNSFIDTRAVPLMNWDVWKTEGTASGITVGPNYSSGMRNERNRVDNIFLQAEPGADINWDVNGPDANISLNANIQGTGQFRARGSSYPLNVVNASTGGSGTTAGFYLTAGANTAYIGRIQAARSDASASSKISFLPLANSALLADALYIQGSATGASAYIGLNGGQVLKRRAVADAATTLSAYDYIVAYTSITAGRTVTLPVASVNTGQVFIIKDESGSAGTFNLTVVVTSSGTIEGASSKVINTAYGKLMVYSNGTEWKVIGGKSNSYTVTRQNDTANVTEGGARILTGWGVFAQGAAANKSETVTFDTAFSSAPIVTVTYGGDNTAGATTYGAGANTVKGPVTAKAHTITTTNFVAQVHTADGTSWGATDNVFYQWMAIGK